MDKKTRTGWRRAHKPEIKVYAKRYYKKHKEKIRRYRKKYYLKNIHKISVYRKKYVKEHCEIASVRNHYRVIFRKTEKQHHNYKGMPFFDGWNPDKGGSWKTGEEWIIKNIGKRPEGCSLHIVEHEKGFVPGNLEWATKKKQAAEQMFKIIARLRHENKRLKERLRIYELDAEDGTNV